MAAETSTASTAGTTSTSSPDGGQPGRSTSTGGSGLANTDATLRPHAQVLSQRGDDAVILLSLTSGRYYTLEGVAARAWELFDGTRTQHEVGAVISQEYGVPLDRAEADLAELIEDLDSEELLAARG
jgi:hypothetical protein